MSMRMLSVLALGPPLARGVLVMSLLFSVIKFLLSWTLQRFSTGLM